MSRSQHHSTGARRQEAYALGYLWDALKTAVHLILTLDPEVVEITWRSLRVSAASTLVATIFCLPLGALIAFRNFRAKRILVNLIQTLYSLPTVCVGIFVYAFIMGRGPLGSLGLVFTPLAMVIGQAILVSPIMIGLTVSALSGVDKNIKDTTLSLGASQSQAMWAIVKEARFGIGATFILGFGRAISEVGVATILGGNIDGYTRTLTTGIALQYNKGDFSLALAWGIILLCVALVIAVMVNLVQQRR